MEALDLGSLDILAAECGLVPVMDLAGGGDLAHGRNADEEDMEAAKGHFHRHRERREAAQAPRGAACGSSVWLKERAKKEPGESKSQSASGA